MKPLGDPTGYRRGLVLGLTLAEALLLILFLLLLAYTVLLQHRDETIQDQKRDLASKDQEIEHGLKPLVDSFTRAGVSVDDPTKLVAHLDQLTRDMAENAVLKQQLEQYAKLGMNSETAAKLSGEFDKARIPETPRQVLEKRLTEESRTQISDAAPPPIDPKTLDEAKKVIGEQRSVIDRQKGQIANVLDRLKGPGNGLTYPPCWARNKQPVYIYDATLLDDGLRLAVRDDRTGMDMSALVANGPEPDVGPEISLGAFINRTTGLFNWSVKQECRFYVRIYDGTSADNKAGYQRARRTVEDHFYILRNE